MPTVIDSLIVKLGLDSKDLDTKSGAVGGKLKTLEGASKQTEGSVKKLGETSKSSASSVETLSRSVGALLAVLGGTYAIKAFIEDTIASSAALDRLSKNLGDSVEDISAWGNAVEEIGGNAKGLQGTMSMLSQSQTELRLTGQSALIPYFASLGVAMANAGGQMRPVNEILLDLADRFSKMDRPTANNMGRMMGIDQDTLNLLLQGREAVELSIKRQKEFNAVSKAQAEEAVKLQRSIVNLKQSFTAMGRGLLESASPAIEKFLSVLTNLSTWIQGNMEFIKDLGAILAVVAAGMAAISLASSPITLTVAAIVALAAGIALLYQDYQTWKRGGDSLIDWEKWKPGIDAATEGVKALAKVVKESFGAIFDDVGAVKKLLNGDWRGALAAGRKSDDKVREGLSTAFHAAVGMGQGLAASGNAVVAGNGHEAPEDAIAQIEGFNAKGKTLNRSQRNHNPGDLEYGPFAIAHGATGTDGRFAIFPNDTVGKAALKALLRTPKYSKMTVKQAVNSFAPPNENNTTKYIQDFDHRVGSKPTDTLAALNARNDAQGGQGGAAGGGSDDHSVSVQTGPITIMSQATDANGIARDFTKSLNFSYAAQANGGLD